jgi:hypothetical protein
VISDQDFLGEMTSVGEMYLVAMYFPFDDVRQHSADV